MITTLGDALLDVIVRLDEPLAAGADALAATQTSVGGQAANVAAWAVALGAEARCVAKRGDDLAGKLVGVELAARGVEPAGPVQGRSGIVVSLVGTDGERTMRRIAAPVRSSRQTSSTRSGSHATVCTSPAMRSFRGRSTALRFARRSLRASGARG